MLLAKSKSSIIYCSFRIIARFNLFISFIRLLNFSTILYLLSKIWTRLHLVITTLMFKNLSYWVLTFLSTYNTLFFIHTKVVWYYWYMKMQHVVSTIYFQYLNIEIWNYRSSLTIYTEVIVLLQLLNMEPQKIQLEKSSLTSIGHVIWINKFGHLNCKYVYNL